MLKKILRGLFTITGLIIGFFIGKVLLNPEYFSSLSYFNNTIILKGLFITLSTLIFGFILFLISPWINKLIFTAVDYMEKSIQKVPANEILFGTAGAIAGLIIASLIGVLFAHVSFFWTVIAVVLAVVMATVGADIAVRKREELMALFSNFKKSGNTKDKKGKGIYKGDPKVLDTSVIIDGRIFDICQIFFHL